MTRTTRIVRLFFGAPLDVRIQKSGKGDDISLAPLSVLQQTAFNALIVLSITPRARIDE
jgi:hypothetical protein